MVRQAMPVGVAFLVTLWLANWLLPSVPRLTLPGGEKDMIVGLSPLGDWAATRGENGLRLWDATTGQLRATIPDYPTPVVSPDGRTLLTRMSPIGFAWDTETGKERFQFPAQWDSDPFEPLQVQFSPDGKTLVSISPIGNGFTLRLTLHDVATGQVRAALDNFTLDKRLAFAISPDSLTLAVVQDISPDVSKDGQTKPPPSLDSLPPQRLLICSLLTGEVQITLPHQSLRIRVLAFSPDGRTLVAGTWHHRDKSQRVTAELHRWNLSTQQAEPPLRLEDLGENPSAERLQFAGQGRFLATDHFIAGRLIWDLSESPPKQIAKGFMFTSPEISPDGRWWAEWNPQTLEVAVTDAATFQVRHRLHLPVASSSIFSQDGQILASICSDKKVRLFEMTTGNELGAAWFPIHRNGNPYFSNDHRTLAIPGPRSLGIWDVPPRRPWWRSFGLATLVGGVVFWFGRWRATRT